MIKPSLLFNFLNSPGTHSKEDAKKVKDYLQKFKEYQDLYRKAMGYDPMEHTLDRKLEDVEWYLNRK